MRISMIIAFFCFCHGISSQGVLPEILASSGDVFDNGNISLQWTLGEIIVGQKSTTQLQLDEGFQQFFETDMSTAVSNLTLDASVELFPNPAIDKLTLLIGSDKSYRYTIINLDGKRLVNGLVSKEKILEISTLPAGGYLIEIRNEERERGVYFFVKS